MSTSLPDVYTTSFRRWVSIRTQLAQTIQEYVKACTSLDSILSAPPLQGSSLHSLDQARAGIGSQLASLLLDEQKLQKARKALGVARDRSHTPTPINSLPSEILAIILSMVNRQCIISHEIRDTSRVHPTILSSVCILWRQTALQIHSLWSHLDLIVTGSGSEAYYQRAKLWAERSKTASLHVHILECEEDGLLSTADVDRTKILKFVGFLAPLMPRVSELEVELANTTPQHLFQSIMACWIKYGSVGSAKMLSVGHGDEDATTELYSSGSLPPNKRVSSNEFNAFFRSMCTLDLRNAVAPWRSALFEGLVDLRINSITSRNWYPTQSDIAGVLASSPSLRSLVLCHLRIMPELGPFVPVVLHDLQVLTLQLYHVQDLQLFLPLVTGESNSLIVTLASLSSDPIFIKEARSFFARSKITTLYIAGEFLSITPVVALLGAIPHLQTLALKYCDFHGGVLQDFIEANTASSSHTLDPWPQLHTLYVLGGDIDQREIRQLVSLHPVQTLRVISENYYGLWITLEGRQEFARVLSESVPDVVCSTSWADDPTGSWDFVGLV